MKNRLDISLKATFKILFYRLALNLGLRPIDCQLKYRCIHYSDAKDYEVRYYAIRSKLRASLEREDALEKALKAEKNVPFCPVYPTCVDTRKCEHNFWNACIANPANQQTV
ncbi:MAG: hypothetical protein FWE37_02660 [Spirochaetaceae bacterium]|nr:hypothetical protein [Spirochaetaceae bacterium]